MSFGFQLYLLICVFLTGICIGSFLNVVIYRLPAGLSVIKPRSRCWSCRTMVKWYDNIPLFSWLNLRGKCRSCQTPISIRYFFVELLVGLLFVAAFISFGPSLGFLVAILLIPAYVATAYIDLDTWTIRIEILLWIAVCGLGAASISALVDQDLGLVYGASVLNGKWIPLIHALLGGLLGFVLLNSVRVLATWYFKKRGRLGDDEEAMGLGDPLLLGVLGMVNGVAAIPLLIFLAALQGSIIGILWTLIGPTIRTRFERAESTEIEDDWVPPERALPFGPYLALAGLELLLWGQEVLTLLPNFKLI